MPLYMDIHSLDGAVTFEDVGKAHQADLQTQGGYDVSYLRYWVDGQQGKIFCLVEAPDADAAATVHREAHGLVAERSTKCRRGHETLRTLAVASTSVVLLVGQAVRRVRAPQHEPPAASITGPTRSATAKYHSLTAADKDGYSILADTAAESPASPNRRWAPWGVHYVKGDLVKNPMIDPKHPEALVYAPDQHGGLHLAALEYVVIKSDWDASQPGRQAWESEVGSSSTADALRTRVQLHRRTQPVRPATVLLAARLGLEGQPRRDLRDVEPQRPL